MKKNILQKISNNNLKVGIIGLGYVGLPLLLRYAEKKFCVIGFDIDPNKIEKIKAGQTYIKHIPEEKIKKAIINNMFDVTTDFKKINDCDAIIICVPTPLGKHLEPDLSFISNTIDAILPHLKKGQIISLESTTYPGTTDEEICLKLKNAGFNIGQDFFVIFSPEREDPGNKSYTTHTIPKVVGGTTKNCLDIGKELYGAVIDKIVPVSSTKAAEMTKLLENIYRAVNIGLINEMKIIADKMEIDIWEVISAAATKPFGFTPFYPGPGLGGHCIPIDPFYLTWKAKEHGFHTRFIELAGEINNSIPQWIITKTMEALNVRKKSLNGSKVLILGIAYKKNIDDMRESPSVEIMELLKNYGAKIYYSDPYVQKFPKMRKHSFDLSSTALSPKLLNDMDAVIIATDHDEFDYQMIQENSDLIIDTRGRFSKDLKNVIKA